MLWLRTLDAPQYTRASVPYSPQYALKIPRRRYYAKHISRRLSIAIMRTSFHRRSYIWLTCVRDKDYVKNKQYSV